jgi:glucose 1-dehydrogenase
VAHFMSSALSYNFAQKRALVTGSSGGIGAGIAKALAQKGARVLVHYNSRHEGALKTKEAIEENGGICDGILQCDFRKPKNVREMFEIVDGVWDGGIDILVNNAGLITKLAVEDDDDDGSVFAETMQVNLHAPYQLSKLAHSRMKEQKEGGVIVNVGSIHGSISVEWMTAYAASKAGLHRLTASLSSEWAEDRVRVNAVAPGIVPVERTEQVLATKEAQDLWLPYLPVGRMGTVEECAHAVIYLCENEWTTGTILTLDGGMTARANMPKRPKPKM